MDDVLMGASVDLAIVRRDIQGGRQAFDGSNGPLDIPVRIWIDEAEKLADEVERLQDELERARAERQDAIDAEKIALIAIGQDNDQLRGVIERLLHWDHFDAAADGPFWRAQLTAALGQERVHG